MSHIMIQERIWSIETLFAIWADPRKKGAIHNL